MEEQFINIVWILFIVNFSLFLYFKLKKKKSAWRTKVNTRIDELDKNVKNTEFIVAKASLIELDKLLEYTLKNAKFKGKTTGEMLKSAKNYFDRDTYNNLWEAHKYRNKLVHEMDHVNSNKLVQLHYSNMRKAIKKITT